MVSKITYNTIKNMLPWDAVLYLQNLEKGFAKDVLVIDLLNAETLHRPFTDTYFRDLYPRGVYLFFNENNIIKYVGQTHQGFYNRLMTQFDVTEMGHFGWNALLRILGGKRTGKPHHELTEDDHNIDYEIIKKFKLLLIDVGSWENMSAAQLKKLEKILMKGFRELEGQALENTGIGWLREEQWKITINDLITA